ncbi:POLR3F [Ecytonucleospora hepatopenaei]|uniref:POLR3F n=1 Tax=Ecytonucleospora hepatopenaei TaxID=646526 RepID=A0A1W0E5I1_9MICR|nr:POLR3F [Ecytonucleospora hepatopenaei]
MGKTKILEFIAAHKDGVTENKIFETFPGLSTVDFVLITSDLLTSNLLEVTENQDGQKTYKAQTLQNSYETLILNLLEDSSDNGVWLKDIKNKTNIPHAYLLKLLRKLEQECKIKSVKSLNTNKKTYVLFDIEPNKIVTGGVWFTNNDIDLDLVNNLMNVLHKFIKNKREEISKKNTDLFLPSIELLPTNTDCHNFLIEKRILQVNITREEIDNLLNVLYYDGKIKKFKIEGDAHYYA